jgi:hypothetical protein
MRAEYEAEGFVQSIPVLTADETREYRAELERTCTAIGGRVSRLDGLHRFFHWAWRLATHPRLLAAIESLAGPGARMVSARVFYKHPHSQSFVGWHQDGITESLEDARVPAVWLGLTDATIENGCLRVVPRSHRLGLVPHLDNYEEENLTSFGRTAQVEIGTPRDLVMRAGEMSVHHPLTLHGSNPNRSDGARIGFSATYSATSFAGDAAVEPPPMPIEEAVALYLASGEQVLFENGGRA